jgi:hypothetical protein
MQILFDGIDLLDQLFRIGENIMVGHQVLPQFKTKEGYRNMDGRYRIKVVLNNSQLCSITIYLNFREGNIR